MRKSEKRERQMEIQGDSTIGEREKLERKGRDRSRKAEREKRKKL